MQILGHSQIQLTLGTYSHVVPELAQEAAYRMGAVLWNCRALSGTSWHTRRASEAAGDGKPQARRAPAPGLEPGTLRFTVGPGRVRIHPQPYIAAGQRGFEHVLDECGCRRTGLHSTSWRTTWHTRTSRLATLRNRRRPSGQPYAQLDALCDLPESNWGQAAEQSIPATASPGSRGSSSPDHPPGRDGCEGLLATVP